MFGITPTDYAIYLQLGKIDTSGVRKNFTKLKDQDDCRANKDDNVDDEDYIQRNKKNSCNLFSIVNSLVIKKHSKFH